jgi:hypothetical protein
MEMSNREKRGWKKRLVEELKSFGVSAIYIWLLLSVFSLHRSIILSEHNISYNLWEGLAFALVNSLILGKFVLIAEALHAGERLEHKPLVYSILFKSAVFAAILLACHVLEDWLVRMWHGRSRAEGGMSLDEILSLVVIVFVALVPFFTAREYVRVVGKEETKAVFLRSRTNPVKLP